MASLRRAAVVLSSLVVASSMSAETVGPGKEKPALENCLEASNETVDFGAVPMGEKAVSHLFVYNFCNHPVPLKYLYIKPPFTLESQGLPKEAPPLGFTALKIGFHPVIPSPGLDKIILVGDKQTRVVLTAHLQGQVTLPPQVALQGEPEHGTGGGSGPDSVKTDVQKEEIKLPGP